MKILKMYFIVETEEQLNRLSTYEECYISLIYLNHNFHPKLSSPSFIYYKSKHHKGYIFPINHNDCLKLDINKIKEFLLKHNKIYVLNKKEIIYGLGEEFLENNIIDINLINLENTISKIDLPDYRTLVSTYIEGSFKHHPNLNSFIPIVKHYEEQENIFKHIRKYMDFSAISAQYNNDYIKNIYAIEKEGININSAILFENYEIKNKNFSIKDNIIYTKYNLYNFTTRPSNSFNGINFLALNKSTNVREFIIPKSDYLFEFDMKSYHLLISAKIIGFQFNTKDIHTELGRLYFNKNILSNEEYIESKKISFRQMNGGVFEQYKKIPFWKQLEDYILNIWKQIEYNRYFELSGGRKINIEEINNPTPQKIYNYIVQSFETSFNMNVLDNLLKYLEDKKSKIISYNYDAFLLDYNKEDNKQILKEIKIIIENSGFFCSVTYGNNYKNLKQLN